MVEKHLDGRRAVFWSAIVDRGQDPGCFRQHHVGNPRSSCDERFGRRDLLGIVACEESDEDVGVNGAHAAFSRLVESRL
jgi:hypothetical protein